jgi:hypothetical protein
MMYMLTRSTVTCILATVRPVLPISIRFANDPLACCSLEQLGFLSVQSFVSLKFYPSFWMIEITFRSSGEGRARNQSMESTGSGADQGVFLESKFASVLFKEAANFLCKAVIHSCECAASSRPLREALILHLLSSDICSEGYIEVEHLYRRIHHDSCLHRLHDHSFRSVDASSFGHFGRTIHVISEQEDLPCSEYNICPRLLQHFQ